jgi:hypothetical protein
MANVVGVMVAGGLIAAVVKVKLNLTFGAEEAPIVLQEMFDKVMPNLLPMAVTLICLYLIKKWNGKHIVAIILSIIVLSVALSMMGILA